MSLSSLFENGRQVNLYKFYLVSKVKIDRFDLRLNLKSLFRGAKPTYKCSSYAIKHAISHKKPEKLVVSLNDIEIDSGDLFNPDLPTALTIRHQEYSSDICT